MSKQKMIIFFACLVVVSVGIILFLSTRTYPSKMIVGGKIFHVDVADTRALLEKGLSGRESLGGDEGMFFVFQSADNHGFWMKDMNFPIDIIWVNSDYRIIYIRKSVSPSTYPEVFYPDAPSQYVLEISAGQSESLHLKIGDKVQFVKK